MRRKKDRVREFLESQGCADHVLAGGLEGLLAAWERTVDEVARGYPLTLDDYLNDLDVRDLLAGAVARAPDEAAAAARERLDRADARLRARLVPAGRCLWGNGVAEDEGWTPATHWWYYMRPAHPGPDLAADLGLAEP